VKQIPPTAKMEELVRLVFASKYSNTRGEQWYVWFPEDIVSSYTPYGGPPILQNTFDDTIKARSVHLVRGEREMKERDVGVVINYKDLSFTFSPKFGFYTEEKE